MAVMKMQQKKMVVLLVAAETNHDLFWSQVVQVMIRDPLGPSQSCCDISLRLQETCRKGTLHPFDCSKSTNNPVEGGNLVPAPIVTGITGVDCQPRG